MLKKILCVLLVVGVLFVNNAPSALAFPLNVDAYLNDLCTYYFGNHDLSKVEYPDATLTTCTVPWEDYKRFYDDYRNTSYIASEWGFICAYEGHGVGFGPIDLDLDTWDHPEKVDLLCMMKK